MRRCKHCGAELVRVKCADCRGYGYDWQQTSRFEYEPVECVGCAGTGETEICPTPGCTSKRRYPATAAESALMDAMVRAINGSGSGKKGSAA